MYLSCYRCITSIKYIHYQRYLSSQPPTVHYKFFTSLLSDLNFTLTSSTRFVAAILSANLSANSPLQFCCCNLGEFKLCALKQIHPFMVQTYPIGCIFSFIFYHKPIRHKLQGERANIYIYIQNHSYTSETYFYKSNQRNKRVMLTKRSNEADSKFQ